MFRYTVEFITRHPWDAADVCVRIGVASMVALWLTWAFLVRPYCRSRQRGFDVTRPNDEV